MDSPERSSGWSFLSGARIDCGHFPPGFGQTELNEM